MRAALSRLESQGYTADFRAEGGMLRHLGDDHLMDPETLLVREVARFEGASDPDDMAAVFALECPECGVRGTYVVAFGPEMAAEDAEVVPKLPDGRTPPHG